MSSSNSQSTLSIIVPFHHRYHYNQNISYISIALVSTTFLFKLLLKCKYKCIQNYFIILCIIQQVERGYAGESSLGTRKLNKLDEVHVLSWLIFSICQSVINLTNDKNKCSPNVQLSLKVK